MRPDISTFNTNGLSDPNSQQTLCSLMQVYITAAVIEDHCTMIMITGGMIHSDFDFLPFHRTYIEKMEDFLILQGYPQFVPLPRWDPSTPTPTAFRVVDADCANANCPGHPSYVCSRTNNWDPQISLPFYLNLPVQNGPNNDLCDWPLNPTFPDPGPNNDGNCFGCGNGLSRVIEGQGGNPVGSIYHNSVHTTMGNYDPPFNSNTNNDAAMINFRSPSAPIFWLWHAYVDDIWKRWECNCTNQSTNNNSRAVDLWIKDRPLVIESERDRGEEPNIDQGDMWISEDIWVRNDNTSGFSTDVTQNPEYQASSPTYVYVRVRNRGCSPTNGNEQFTVYWAKGGTFHNWPAPWDGNTQINGITIGGTVGTQSVGVIPAGGSKIIRFAWNVPNPSQFGPMDGASVTNGPADGWHFCLLGRVEPTATDPDFGNINGQGLGDVLRGNNNFAMKNVTVVDFAPGIMGPGLNNGGTIAVGNLNPEPATISLQFDKPAGQSGNAITEDADVILSLNPALWDKWINGGMQGSNVRIYAEDTRQILVTGTGASLNNLTFEPEEINTINIKFEFLVEKISAQEKYQYVVRQLNTEGIVTGGELYDVTRPQRDDMFLADAGPDKTITDEENAELEAAIIDEPALYKWYNPAGELIYEGTSFTVTPEITTKYTLELIAEDDRFKDYDEVQVNVKNNFIRTIYPNPTSESSTLEYKLAEGTTSAYIILSQPYGGTYNNYILDINQAQANIDVSALIPGVYTISLICNGQLVDVKTISKQ